MSLPAGSVPRLTHVSSPTSFRIRPTAFPTGTSSRRLRTASPDATIENSLAPRFLAFRAAATISSSSIIGYFGISAFDRLDWEQKEQSSEQSPGFALTMEQSRSPAPLNRRRTASVTSRRRHSASRVGRRTDRASGAPIPLPHIAASLSFFQKISVSNLIPPDRNQEPFSRNMRLLSTSPFTGRFTATAPDN